MLTPPKTDVLEKSCAFPVVMTELAVRARYCVPASGADEGLMVRRVLIPLFCPDSAPVVVEASNASVVEGGAPYIPTFPPSIKSWSVECVRVTSPLLKLMTPPEARKRSLHEREAEPNAPTSLVVGTIAPFTSSFAEGAAVPMPTRPEEKSATRVLPLTRSPPENVEVAVVEVAKRFPT